MIHKEIILNNSKENHAEIERVVRERIYLSPSLGFNGEIKCKE